MKKLLVLMLVLGMVSVANAGLISVVVDQIEKAPGNTGEGAEPSDIIHIKIVSQVILDAYDFDLHVTGPGTLIETNGGPGAEWQPYGTNVPLYQALNRQDTHNIGNDSLWGYSGIQGSSISQMTWAMLDHQFSSGDLIWGLAIHCEGQGDVIVDLTQGQGGTGVAGGASYGDADYDDLVISQTPEPMTLALLGLGGLFLRRRK